MIQSMTGFGQAAGQVLGRDVSLELRSVNNRFRDVVVRLPKQYFFLEGPVKKAVAERVSRGRIEVSVQVSAPAEPEESLKLDLELAKAYHKILMRLKHELGLGEEVSLSHLIGLRNVIVFEEESIAPQAFMTGLAPVLEEALDNLVEMRQTEGQAMAEDFTARLASMSGWVEEIDSRRALVTEEIKTKIEERVKALTGGMELDQGRLFQEVAYLIDRGDITEEIVRLRSHFGQFGSLIETGGVVGRRFEFFLQEINREVNTIGSKSGDAGITGLVVDLKTELEKIREQVQNVE